VLVFLGRFRVQRFRGSRVKRLKRKIGRKKMNIEHRTSNIEHRIGKNKETEV
jgi:hypothetical protein